MASVQIFQVDAFSDLPFAGNPAGVVLDAGVLAPSQMQLIARELNNSETAFVLAPDAADHDVHLRFFTPTTEVPICGHATIAAHYIRAIVHDLGSCTTVQRTKAGLTSVFIEKRYEENTYRITVLQNRPEFSAALDDALCGEVLIALGLSPGDIDMRCPVQVVTTGHSKLLIGLNKTQALDRIVPDLAALARLSDRIGSNGYFAFVLHPEGVESSKGHGAKDGPYTEGRMFAPAIGIPEDPVTGNANGPLGAYIVRHKLFPHGGRSLHFEARQGRHVGRPGQMDVVVSNRSRYPRRGADHWHGQSRIKTLLEL